MPAITWTCTSCNTVNTRNVGKRDECMVCGATEEAARATPTAKPEVPTVKIEVAPSLGERGKTATAKPKSATDKASATAALKPPVGRVKGILPTGTGSRTAADRTTRTTAGLSPTPIVPVTSPSATSPTFAWTTPPVPPTPATPSSGTVRPRVPAAPSTAYRRGGSNRGLREFSVGRLLGIGHVALFVTAFQLFLAQANWGGKVLTWAYDVAGKVGAQLGPTTVNGWINHGIVYDANEWLHDLPWGMVTNFYVVLAIGCLIIRLVRPLPGWLSLVIALPAAAYGGSGALADFAWLATFWPITLPALVVAWIFTAKTVSRY